MAEEKDDELIGDEPGETSPGTFDDPGGGFPPKNYWYQSSLNKGWRGADNKQLGYFGADGKDLKITSPELPTEATKNDINTTPAGHVIEFNDTPGGERILIKHRTGAGIDILPDGSIGISVGKSHIMTIKDDMTIVVSGNASYDFKGDVDFKVAGDFNVSALNMNVNLKGNLKETIKGNHRETVTKNKGTVVLENKSETIIGANSITTLGNNTNITKGELKLVGEGIVSLHSGNKLYMTGQTSMDISSPKANIAADTLLLMGSTGTIGGEGVVMYGKGATFGEGVSAPTFTGDLKGTAQVAATSLHQSYADGTYSGPGSYSPNTGSQGSITDTATPTTVLPTSTILSDYLNEGGKGVMNVSIDETELKNAFNKLKETGGLSTTEMTTNEVRSKFRDQNNRANEEFVSHAVATGKLNSEYANSAAPSVGRIAAKSGTQFRGQTKIGNRGSNNFSDFTPTSISTTKKFLPNLNTIISNTDNVTSATKLAEGITVANFLSGSGEVANFNTTKKEDRAKVARNLQANAYIMKWINNNRTSGAFSNYTLKVVEAYYEPSTAENLIGDDIKDLATKGRAVVYELIHNNSGLVDDRKTFELAIYLKDLVQYDKMILDYDSYSPSGSINTQLIITVPEINESYSATFDRQIETRFNNAVQSNSDFIEVKAA